jgi:hypothetical protein
LHEGLCVYYSEPVVKKSIRPAEGQQVDPAKGPSSLGRGGGPSAPPGQRLKPFWDFKHGQTGVAPNAIELHPILGFACLSG